MKRIEFNNPIPNGVETTLTEDVVLHATTINVVDASNYSPNDLLLLEENGYEFSEICVIDSINSNQITLTQPIQYEHKKDKKVTKILYDKFFIEVSDKDSDYVTLVTEDINYGSLKNMFVYEDIRETASDDLYYKIYYRNSVTDTNVLQATLHKERNFSYITPESFMTQLNLTSTLFPSTLYYEILQSGLQFIQSKLFSERILLGEHEARQIYTLDLDSLHLTDKDGDRKVTKNDIVVYIEDQQGIRTYINYLIKDVYPNSNRISFNKMIVPHGRLVFSVPCTFKPFSELSSIYSEINKLYSINHILLNSTNKSLKDAVSSWSAGGTNVTRDGSSINTVIEMNERRIQTLLDEVTKSLYTRKTKFRTDYSTLNYNRFGRFGHPFVYGRR